MATGYARCRLALGRANTSLFRWGEGLNFSGVGNVFVDILKIMLDLDYI